MKRALKNFPWFEAVLIVGLAFALIVKPQSRVVSAAPQAQAPTAAATAAK